MKNWNSHSDRMWVVIILNAMPFETCFCNRSNKMKQITENNSMRLIDSNGIETFKLQLSPCALQMFINVALIYEE